LITKSLTIAESDAISESLKFPNTRPMIKESVMNARPPQLQKFLLVTLLVASSLSTATVFAQSTNRQLGTSYTVTANPLVSRPSTQPCVVQLFSNYTFAFFSDTQQTFSFTPPASCPGPWAKVVFEANFSENGGIQFDRTASLYLGDLNLYFGTTPEPLQTATNTWHVERDVTNYSALLATAQPGDMELQNCTTDCPPPYNTYLNGVFTVSADLEFYPAQPGQSETTADVVLPLVQTNGSGGTNLPATLQPGQQLSTTFTLPTNIERAYLIVIAQNQSDDETYWGCFPNNLGKINDVYGCAHTNYRETEITIDGRRAGLAPVSPWVFTGDLPDDWVPIPGAQTLDLAPYRVNLTPFAALLSDGSPHTIALSVFNNDSYWSTTASLVLLLDKGTTQITGSITENNLTGPSPVVTEKLNGTAVITGTIGVQSNRSFTIAGYVNTSHGKVSTSISEQQNFSSTEGIDFAANGSVADQNTSLNSSVTTDTTVTNSAGTRVTDESWSFPMTVRFAAPVSSAPFGYTQAFTQRYSTSEQVWFNGTPTFSSSLTNAVNATDVSPTSSSQRYTFSDSNGASYNCDIVSKNAVLTAVSSGCSQGAQ
jgi:hypothetical protein